MNSTLYDCCTVYVSLVNQPYISCAHISQSAHAHDEGAGKIRLAKPARVLCALAEICQSQSDCSKWYYSEAIKQFLRAVTPKTVHTSTHVFNCLVHPETLIWLIANASVKTGITYFVERLPRLRRFIDIRNRERAPSALQGLAGVLAYGYTPWCRQFLHRRDLCKLQYYVMHVSTFLRSIDFGRNMFSWTLAGFARRIFPAPSSRACALWEICAQEKYGWFTRIYVYV